MADGIVQLSYGPDPSDEVMLQVDWSEWPPPERLWLVGLHPIEPGDRVWLSDYDKLRAAEFAPTLPLSVTEFVRRHIATEVPSAQVTPGAIYSPLGLDE